MRGLPCDAAHPAWSRGLCDPCEFTGRTPATLGAGAAIVVAALRAPSSTKVAVELLEIWVSVPIASASSRVHLLASTANTIGQGSARAAVVPQFPPGFQYRNARNACADLISATSTEFGVGTTIAATVESTFSEVYMSRFATAVGLEDQYIRPLVIPGGSLFTPESKGFVVRCDPTTVLTNQDIVGTLWRWREWKVQV